MAGPAPPIVVVGALCLTAAGCFVDRAGAADRPPQRGADASQVDARVDAAPGPDAASPLDGGSADTPDSGGALDSGPLDSGLPDAGARPSCDDAFGGATAYELCAETATECRFYTRLDLSRSCDDVCGGAGCVSVRDNGVLDRCSAGGTLDCSGDYLNAICTCNRP